MSGHPVPSGFSYATLDADAAAIAKSAAEVIQGVQRQAVQEIGRCLLQAKDAMPHGAFTAWLCSVVNMPPTTARNYMRAARWLDGKPATVADLPPTILYALANPAASAEIVQGVVANASTGMALDAADIRAKLDNDADEQRELKVAQRRSPKLTVAKLRARRERDAVRQAAERKRDDVKAEQERAEREQRLRPLAEAVASLGAAPAGMLLAALTDYRDQQALMLLLREAVQ